jgi:hypothetical protein
VIGSLDSLNSACHIRPALVRLCWCHNRHSISTLDDDDDDDDSDTMVFDFDTRYHLISIVLRAWHSIYMYFRTTFIPTSNRDDYSLISITWILKVLVVSKSNAI